MPKRLRISDESLRGRLQERSLRLILLAYYFPESCLHYYGHEQYTRTFSVLITWTFQSRYGVLF